MPRLALIQFLDGADGPSIDNTLPGYIGGRPDNSLPGGRPVRPDNGLPVGPPGSIGTLPVFPFDPTVGPDNELPGPQPTPTPPIQVHPGLKLVVKWVACLGFIAVPDNSLPDSAQPK